MVSESVNNMGQFINPFDHLPTDISSIILSYLPYSQFGKVKKLIGRELVGGQWVDDFIEDKIYHRSPHKTYELDTMTMFVSKEYNYPYYFIPLSNEDIENNQTYSYFINGQRYGLSISYSTINQREIIRWVCYFRHDRIDGPFHYWFEDGNLHKLMNYYDGKLHGECITYYKGGYILMCISRYFNGKKDGEQEKITSEEGVKTLYKNGVAIPNQFEITMYDYSPKKISHYSITTHNSIITFKMKPSGRHSYKSVIFNNGDSHTSNYYDNGQIYSLQEFKYMNRYDEYRWDEFGNIIQIDKKTFNRYTYSSIFTYHNRGIQTECHYKNYQLNGPSKRWDIYGELIWDVVYKDGEIVLYRVY